MSFIVKRNRLAEFSKAFKQFSILVQQKEVTRRYATFAAKRLQTLFVGVTPSGSRWTEPIYESPKGRSVIHGRPSFRQFGEILSQSWQQAQIDNTHEGTSFVLGTSTEQMSILLKGAPSHPIPRSGLITFWSFREGTPAFFGGRGERGFINHPGFERLTAFEQAYHLQGKGLVAGDFARARRAIYSPLANLFGAKQVF